MALIIVVDDDRYVRSGLENLLASAGYESTSVASGEELLEQLKNLNGHCIILDVKMTGISGLEVQQALNLLQCRIPVVFLSAHFDKDTREKALSAGAFAFLPKPVDEEELLNKIAEAISSGCSG